MSSFLQEWITIYVIPNISPTTHENYQKIINRYINPILGHLALEDITPIMVQKWVNSLSSGDYLNAKKGLKPQTVKNIFLVLHSSMDKAVELKLVQESPCLYTQLPKLIKYNAQVLDEIELQKFFKALKGNELETAMMIIITLGLRRGEAIALRWKSIDWINKTISITESMVQTSKNTNHLKEPKSKAGIRSIVMPNHLYEYLKAEYERLKTLDKNFSENDIKNIRLHDLRHTTATLMLTAGVSPKVAQQVLGHSTISMTLDTYSHVLQPVQVDATDKIDKQLFG